MFSRGGSRDALVHSLPMEPSVKKFQDSVRREPPNRFLMIEHTDMAVIPGATYGGHGQAEVRLIGFSRILSDFDYFWWNFAYKRKRKWGALRAPFAQKSKVVSFPRRGSPPGGGGIHEQKMSHRGKI